jgi:small nuclear ribonucleoprotein (snRNP)-like protein
MVGKRVLIRTYSAGVHIGTLEHYDNMEAHLTDALRLWKWEGGGLSLSAVANQGVKKARIDRTVEVYLTNVIEIIPTTPGAEKTYARFIES